MSSHNDQIRTCTLKHTGMQVAIKPTATGLIQLMLTACTLCMQLHGDVAKVDNVYISIVARVQECPQVHRSLEILQALGPAAEQD